MLQRRWERVDGFIFGFSRPNLGLALVLLVRWRWNDGLCHPAGVKIFFRLVLQIFRTSGAEDEANFRRMKCGVPVQLVLAEPGSSLDLAKKTPVKYPG